MTKEFAKAVIPYTNITIEGLNKTQYNITWKAVSDKYYNIKFNFSKSMTEKRKLKAHLEKPLWFKANTDFNLINNTDSIMMEPHYLLT